jgi:hypothetical protein
MKVNLKTPTEKMFVSTRVKQALLQANINCVEELLTQTKKDLDSIQNLGAKGIAEIRKMLSISGFSLLNDLKNIDDYVFENAKLTLRDQFALGALQGLLSFDGTLNNRSIVFSAHQYADMMMEVRDGNS